MGSSLSSAERRRPHRLEDLEALAAALRVARKSKQISKQDLSIRVTADGTYLCVTGDQAARFASEAAMLRSMRDDADERVWLCQGDAILDAYREVRGAAPRKAPTPEKSQAKSKGIWAGGRYSMFPDALVDSGLIAMMPAPVLRGYIVCARRADRVTGRFFTSHARFARDIGYKGKVKRARTKGAASMAPLVASGLVTIERAGAPGRATDYKLTVPITDAVITRAREVFTCPPQRGAHIPRGGGQHIPRSGDTKKNPQEETVKKNRRAR
jgi:hypothetical protein